MSFGCWFNLFFLALFIPVLLIFFNGLGSFLILDSTFKNDALVLMASLMVFSSIFLFVIHRGNSSSLFNFICSLGLAALYIAMGTVQGLKIINAHFDESEPQTVEVSITKKYRGSSDSGYYYKVVFSESTETAAGRIGVSESTYEQIQIDQKMKLQYRKGYLGYTWMENSSIQPSE